MFVDGSHILDANATYSRVPVLHEIRDITLAKNDQGALVSYENKVSVPRWPTWIYADDCSPRHPLNYGSSILSKTP